MKYTDGEAIKAREHYWDYEGKYGMSTISARGINSNGEDHNFYTGVYVYWNFEDNEVVQLSIDDGNVSHNPKEIKPGPEAGDSVPLKDYKLGELPFLGEIAFYRRKRTHDAIEKSGHQGKFAPDAIICKPTKENMQKIKETFGEMIPIICPERGYFQYYGKNNIKVAIEDFTESEKEKEDITEEKKEFLDQSYGAVGVTQGDLMTSGDLLKQTKEEKRENFVSKVDSERQDIKNYEER